MARLTSQLVLSMDDQISAKARMVDRNLDRLEHRQRGAGTAMVRNQGLAQKMAGSMGAMAIGAAGIVAPLAAGLGAREVITQAADFESALTNIQKKAGTSAAQTAKLGEEIKSLATSGELAVPIEEIAAAYERGAAAGIPLDELKQFATLSAKAADAFEMSATDVGNAAAGFKVGLGIPINEMARYFDLINGLADSGIADESGIVNFLDRGGASLKLFGLSAQEAAAYAATMSNLKMAPDIGANALSTLTGKLLSPGSESAEIALRNIVGNVDDFQKILKKDANKALMIFLERINKLDKFRATELLNGFVGAGFDDEILRLAAGIEEAQKNLKFAAGTDWFGSLGKSYDLKLDDFWSKWQLLKNEMGKLTIDIGTAGMPALKSGLEGVVGIVKRIGDGMKEFERLVDWNQFNDARDAVNDLGHAVGDLLNTDTSKSQIGGFFEGLAGSVNDVTAAITKVEEVLNRANNIKLLKPPATPQEAEDRRFEALKERVRKDEAKRQWMRDMPAMNWIPDSVIGDRPSNLGLNEYDQANWGRAQADLRREEETARQEKLARAAEREASYQRSRMSAAQAYAISDTGSLGVTHDSGAKAIPTPRPDILGPVTTEGEAAALKAQEIGQRISDAFSVTTRPIVDPSSIAAADRVAAALEARLGRIAQQQVAVRNGASTMTTGGNLSTDFDGLHAGD